MDTMKKGFCLLESLMSLRKTKKQSQGLLQWWDLSMQVGNVDFDAQTKLWIEARDPSKLYRPIISQVSMLLQCQY